VPGLKNKADKAWLLADNKRKPLNSISTPEGMTVSVPLTAPDSISSTVVVHIKGPLEIEQIGLTQAPDGSLTLPAREARTHGEIKYESGEHRDSLGFWTNPNDWADWEFRVTRPGKVEVFAEVASLEAASIEVRTGKERTRAHVPVTGDYGRFEVVKLGTLEVPAGNAIELSLRAVKEGWQPVNVRCIRLQPAK
jgi:hypothetical protein